MLEHQVEDDPTKGLPANLPMDVGESLLRCPKMIEEGGPLS
jgi:hypothetical protein